MSDDFPSIEAAAAVTGLRGRVGLTMHSDGGPFAARLALFAGRLSGLSEMLDLSMASDGAEPPHLEMTAEGCGRLRFAVHPEGPELRPFLNAVGSFGVRDDSCIDPTVRLSEHLAKRPAKIEVFVTPQCPFCGRVVEIAVCLALVCERFDVLITDAAEFSARAAAVGVRSVPAVFVDDRLRWVGRAGTGDILAVLDTDEKAWRASLKSIVNAGAIDNAVDEILKDPLVVRALPGLLLEPEFPLRAAVLRIIEDAAMRNRSALGEMFGPLCGLLEHGEARVRGDAAYGLGLLGNAAARPFLRERLNDEDPDVRDTARDAMDMLGSN